MSEFLGSRISLVSRSDIRYVGTLHEINSESSTVALENVTSFGTEGRKNSPDEEIPPSDSVYEYIVFRGSDVKDLRIEEPPAAKENKPPQVLNDPAILGSGFRPPQAHPSQAPAPAQSQQQGPPPQQPSPNERGPQQFGPPPGVPPFSQYQPQFYPPPPTGWGRGGPPGPGYPGMPYGAPPPGWYPPPGQGFPQHPGQFPPYGFPPGPPGQQFPPNQQPPNQGQKPAPIGPGANKQQAPPTGPAVERQSEPKNLAKPAAETAAASSQKAPTPPVSSKPSVTEVQALSQSSPSELAANSTIGRTPVMKNGHIQPALPLQAPRAALRNASTNATSSASPSTTATSNLRDATEAATAAVAAAMAKLPPVGGQSNGSAMDNLTKKVNEMRASDPVRAPRHPGASGGFTTRGRGRGGSRQSNQKVEVPSTDFDFESSNAKFNKQDLVKEAIAGSPLGETAPVISPTDYSEQQDVPVSGYNKSTSFFDNISSESKDRAEAGNDRPSGREWRGEEQKKNVETFGQGSVDNGYRGGFRGRGRGRGGFRGRGGYTGNGQPGRGRGGYRGNRGDFQIV